VWSYHGNTPGSKETCLVHANAPLTAEGRRRLVARVLEQGRPQAHVATESRLARATVRKWVGRFLAGGAQALADRSSRPHRSPTRTDPAVVARIERLRRDRKLPPRLIVDELAADGIEVSAAIVHRWLRRLGISRLRDLDVTGTATARPAGSRPTGQVSSCTWT